MSETYEVPSEGYEKRLAWAEYRVDNLVAKYLAMADREYAKFRDDSWDSDIAGAWFTKEMLDARRKYELYITVAHDIASIMGKDTT
ncbi:MAG TPA: hypothetical protein PLJ04_03820 [Candidatus Saccharibacteria bacterium]|nr:hypothetical protein [Candidatus Saccharibacteria bacterium]MCB9817796.1 hypothetical protein [Candidatus Nomurabacteria bacterium]HPR10684.1 hypothetical protein [Candidatus Saccharibacteria bacterium]